jgi:hypothetical protein
MASIECSQAGMNAKVRYFHLALRSEYRWLPWITTLPSVVGSERAWQMVGFRVIFYKYGKIKRVAKRI